MKKYRIAFTKRFHKDYAKLPQHIQKKTDDQIRQLKNGEFSHPSLRMKKMEVEKNIWEASVTKNYRIIFIFEDDLLTVNLFLSLI